MKSNKRAMILRTNSRNARGNMLILAPAGAIIVILLGALSFDIISIRDQFNQLQAATDAAALAAATYLSDPDNSDTATVKQVGLTYFQMNQLTSGSLSSAILSSSALTDTPSTGASTLNVIVNLEKKTVTAQSAFGFCPFLLKFLGTYPLHATSTAGPGKSKTGDVCIVLDLSSSMRAFTFRKQTAKFSRKFHKNSNFLEEKITGPPGGQVPFLSIDPTYTQPFGPTIPNPGNVPYSPPGGPPIQVPPEVGSAPFPAIDQHTPLMKAALDSFANRLSNPPPGSSPPVNPFSAPPNQPVKIDDVKAALLVEAKAGNLENATKFVSSHANQSVLKFIPGFQPQPGFRAEYQRIALAVTNPRSACVQAVHFFMDSQKGQDIHWSLVSFGARAGTPGSKGTVFDPSNIGQFRFPLIELDRNKDNLQEVLEAIDRGTFSLGTDTPAGIKEGINQLTGSGHRPGRSQTMILLTDGVPTKGGTGKMAAAAGAKGIKIITIGFFLNPTIFRTGVRVCKNIALKAGNGSKAFLVGDGKTPAPPSEQQLLDAQVELEKAMIQGLTASGVALQ
jgi:Flp pilus assembly protein TadG